MSVLKDIGNLPFVRNIGRGDKVGLHKHYQLTPLGKSKLDDLKLDGADGEVAAAIEDGSDTVSEIANYIHRSPEKVKIKIRHLLRSGYIVPMRGE